MNKQKLVQALKEHLEEQITTLQEEVVSVNEEIAKETKSSAGDKFETSREMMNQERGRLEERIAHLQKQQNNLLSLNSSAHHELITNGTLVETTSVFFFFGMAYGKFQLDKNTVMVLSLNSPIGKAFFNKQVGDKILFMNTDYEIVNIY